MEPGSGQESSLQDTVLIAEDDPLFRRVLERCLQKWDYRVIALENGLEAWSVLQKKMLPRWQFWIG
jgi:CheY-like chemotaxis protein